MLIVGGTWKFPVLSRKAHFFKDGEAIALCGRWSTISHTAGYQNTRRDAPGPDDCERCWRLAQQLVAGPNSGAVTP